MNSLRISGYFAPYRFSILKGILNRIRQCNEEIRLGTRRKYRSREEILACKKSKSGNFVNTWFLKQDITQILKVPCTPGSKLVQKYRDVCGQSRGPDGGRTKYVEMGGTPISLLFPNKDNFGGNSGCHFRTKCYIDESQDCRISKAVYRIECKTCENRGGPPYIYIGTTGFTMHKRNLEHAQNVKSKSTSNALAKHMALHHAQDEANLVTTCLAGGIKFNLNRFILEAIEIEEVKTTPGVHIMNSRSDGGGRGLPRINIIQ